MRKTFEIMGHLLQIEKYSQCPRLEPFQGSLSDKEWWEICARGSYTAQPDNTRTAYISRKARACNQYVYTTIYQPDMVSLISLIIDTKPDGVFECGGPYTLAWAVIDAD